MLRSMFIYDNSSFDFGLETESDQYSGVAKFGKFEILDMRLAKTQFIRQSLDVVFEMLVNVSLLKHAILKIEKCFKYVE